MSLKLRTRTVRLAALVALLLALLAPGASTPERLDWIDPSSQLTPDLFWPTFLPGAREFLLTIRTEDGAWIHVASMQL